jgi:hypothetical protein
VLVTDDNAINRKVAKLFLTTAGLEVAEACNGAEALAKLGSERFDIVLMDIHMPVMDGVEAIKRIRADDAAWSAVPVVALTADAMAGAKERYIEMGMTGYVAKPIDQGELFAAILAALFAQTTRDVAA